MWGACAVLTLPPCRWTLNNQRLATLCAVTLPPHPSPACTPHRSPPLLAAFRPSAGTRGEGDSREAGHPARLHHHRARRDQHAGEETLRLPSGAGGGAEVSGRLSTHAPILLAACPGSAADLTTAGLACLRHRDHTRALHAACTAPPAQPPELRPILRESLFPAPQTVVDAPNSKKSDLRRARSALCNLAPTSTGSATAIALIFPGGPLQQPAACVDMLGSLCRIVLRHAHSHALPPLPWGLPAQSLAAARWQPHEGKCLAAVPSSPF